MQFREGFANRWLRAEQFVWNAAKEGGVWNGSFPDPHRNDILCGCNIALGAIYLAWDGGITFNYPLSEVQKALADVRRVACLTAQDFLDNAESLSDLCDVFCSPIGEGLSNNDIPQKWRAGNPPVMSTALRLSGVGGPLAWWEDHVLVSMGDGDALWVVDKNWVAPTE